MTLGERGGVSVQAERRLRALHSQKVSSGYEPERLHLSRRPQKAGPLSNGPAGLYSRKASPT